MSSYFQTLLLQHSKNENVFWVLKPHALLACHTIHKVCGLNDLQCFYLSFIVFKLRLFSYRDNIQTSYYKTKWPHYHPKALKNSRVTWLFVVCHVAVCGVRCVIYLCSVTNSSGRRRCRRDGEFRTNFFSNYRFAEHFASRHNNVWPCWTLWNKVTVIDSWTSELWTI